MKIGVPKLVACLVAGSIPVAGCATAPSGAPAGESRVSAADDVFATYEIRVDAIAVSDSAGEPYRFPWLGGFNLPRPQLVDIDGDGDFDLFVQESSGRVMYFENVGSAGAAEFDWRSEAFQDIEAGEWYRFAPMDEDDDVDLLTEEVFSYIRYWRNAGSPSNPLFELAADSLRDADGVPIFSDRQNIPNIADIDCDGQLDLLIGRLTGTITHYEEIGRDDDGLPRFRHLTDRFQNIEIIGTFGPGGNPGGAPGAPANPVGSLHGANTLALADFDGDGDLDLFWGDFFEPGLLYIRNEGTCERPDLDSEPIPFPPNQPLSTSGYNAPTLADLDGDGDLDMLVGVLGGAFNPNRTTIDNFHYLEQVAPDVFETRTSRFLPNLDVGSESVPVIVDWDGDGDLDLLVANKLEQDGTPTSRIYRFENVGGPTEPRFALRGRLPGIEGDYHYAPAIGDIDGDGRFDMVLGTWRADLQLWRGVGDGELVRDTSFDVRLTRGTNAAPVLVDIDGDGDLDLFVGEASGELNFYRNTGTPGDPEFTLETDNFGGIDPGRRSVPTFADIDGDGDLDLVLGTETNGLIGYRNDGPPDDPRFTEIGTLPVPAPAYATPAFADIDADGDLELFVGGNGGGVMYFEVSRP